MERLSDVLRARRALQRKSASPKGTQMQELSSTWPAGRNVSRSQVKGLTCDQLPLPGPRAEQKEMSGGLQTLPIPAGCAWGCVPSQLWNPWPSRAGHCSKAQVQGEQVNTGFLQPQAREQLHFKGKTAWRELLGPVPSNRTASHSSIVFIITFLTGNSLPSATALPLQAYSRGIW